MSDILENLLAEHGFNTVKWPKEDIAPLHVLYKTEEGHLTAAESTVERLFEVKNHVLPPVMGDKKFSPMEGGATVVLGAAAGISLLDHLLSKLKLGKISSKLSLNNSDKLSIRFENVMENKVDVVLLDTYITGSEVNVPEFTTFRQRLENSELYVITTTLKSNSFSVTVTDAAGKSLDVEATIKGIADVNTSVNKNKDNSVTIKNGDETPLVFAFKAQQIMYDKTFWQSLFGKDGKFHIRDATKQTMKGGEEKTTPLEVRMEGYDI